MTRRRYRTDWVRRFKAKARRERLRAQGACINGADHGEATHGVLCAPCRAQHRKSN